MTERPVNTPSSTQPIELALLHSPKQMAPRWWARTKAEPSSTRRSRKRYLAVVPVAAAAVGIVATQSFAFFTAQGSGAGTASAGALQPVVVTALTGGDNNAALLIPGGTADVILRIDNPNPFPVRLTSLTQNGTIVADILHPSCSPTGVTFSAPTINQTIAASTTTPIVLVDAAAMDNTSATGCQGSQFAIPVAITVQTP